MKDDIVYKSLLYDFYGELLTENQKNIIDMYYNLDYSLGEISEVTQISRQGIYDTLKRAENTLWGYEKKLKLVEKYIKQNSLLKKIDSEIDKILPDMIYNSKIKETLIEIKDIIKELV